VLFLLNQLAGYMNRISWAWAILVLLVFFAFALGKSISTTVAYLFLIESFVTLLIPGMLLLTEKWHPFGGTP